MSRRRSCCCDPCDCCCPPYGFYGNYGGGYGGGFGGGYGGGGWWIWILVVVFFLCFCNGGNNFGFGCCGGKDRDDCDY